MREKKFPHRRFVIDLYMETFVIAPHGSVKTMKRSPRGFFLEFQVVVPLHFHYVVTHFPLRLLWLEEPRAAARPLNSTCSGTRVVTACTHRSCFSINSDRARDRWGWRGNTQRLITLCHAANTLGSKPTFFHPLQAAEDERCIAVPTKLLSLIKGAANRIYGGGGGGGVHWGEENIVSPSHEVETLFCRFILCLHVRSRVSLMSREKLSPRQQTHLNHYPAVCYTFIVLHSFHHWCYWGHHISGTHTHTTPSNNKWTS